MRNLHQYPITLDEAIEAVEEELRKYESRMAKLSLQGCAPIGDIHGLALKEAASRLKRLQFAGTP